MKTPHAPRLLIGILTGFLLSSGIRAQPRSPADLIPNPVVQLAPTEANFPYVVSVRVTPAPDGFRAGDNITIIQVRGDRPVLEPGGVYWFTGTYQLKSESTARLSLSLTRPSPDHRGMEINKTHTYVVEQGNGTFSFLAKMGAVGNYHVSWHLQDKNNRKAKLQGGVNIQRQ